MAKRKVNLYKWHRMKRKLISSVISVLCCLTVMAIGVFASTSQSFETAVSNDISIHIAVVDGTLFAKRRGGVYSAEKNPTTNAYYITDSTKRGQVVTDENNTFKNFVEIYNRNANKTPACAVLESQRIDVNVYNNEIEYVFKYVVEEENDFPTYLYIMDNSVWTGGKDKLEVLSYKYIYKPLGTDESNLNSWWSSATELSFNGVNSAVMEVGGNGASAEQLIYIRCYVKYNTLEYGNLGNNSNPTGTQYQYGQGNADYTYTEEDLESLDLAYDGLWKFSLVLTSGAPSL